MRMPALALAALAGIAQTAPAETVELRVVQTSDVHGCFLPYDFTGGKPSRGSMARVSSYVRELRAEYGNRLILLDNGDILQGQPTSYYYNYERPDMENIAATAINLLGYDAQVIGNHDIETGHDVYDKWIGEVECPVLGANVIDAATGRPYARPYVVLERGGVRVAVLGMTTPAIPNWLDGKLWEGLAFEDMTRCAKEWVPYIMDNERPDVVIGLFHSGWDGGIVTEDYEEDAARRVAAEVPGFDLILYGHDHRRNVARERNPLGGEVLCLNPANNAMWVCDATIRLSLEDGRVTGKEVTGTVTDVRDMPIDGEYMARFRQAMDDVGSYVGRKVCTLGSALHSSDAFFGSSAFCDMVHNLQLRMTGADISLTAPLSPNATIGAGDVHVGDMFNLYRFENKVCVVRMTGREVLGLLEMSYGLWTNTMESPDDDIMLLSEGDGRSFFRNPTFNFDSAAGIDYEVDVTKPAGRKVRILGMSGGEPFEEDRWYDVAMNSYRANGGGELLTKGAGIPKDSIAGRISFESERDLRHYLMLEMEEAGKMDPRPNGNWRFVPQEWAVPAAARDRELIFGR